MPLPGRSRPAVDGDTCKLIGCIGMDRHGRLCQAMLTGVPDMSCMFKLSLRTSSGLETVILLSQDRLQLVSFSFSDEHWPCWPTANLRDSIFHSAEAYGRSWLQQASALECNARCLHAAGQPYMHCAARHKKCSQAAPHTTNLH